jgi:hypothetical protein
MHSFYENTMHISWNNNCSISNSINLKNYLNIYE